MKSTKVDIAEDDAISIVETRREKSGAWPGGKACGLKEIDQRRKDGSGQCGEG